MMAASGEDRSGTSAVVIRDMRASDLSALSSILKESREASSWSGAGLLDSARSGVAWVAELDGHIVGFLVGRGVAEEFEILNLAVAKSSRRQGVATQMLESMAGWLRTSRIQRAYLEVRESNEAALALYARHGFQPCGRRDKYYRDPVEDAVVLLRETRGSGGKIN